MFRNILNNEIYYIILQTNKIITYGHMGLKVEFNLELDENVWTFIQEQSSELGITVDEYVENINITTDKITKRFESISSVDIKDKNYLE